MGLFMLALGLAVANYKAGENNRTKEHCIDSMSQDAVNLVQRIDRNIDRALADCNHSLAALHEAKQDIIGSTFLNFIDVAKNIMNISFDDRIDDAQTLKSTFDFQRRVNIDVTHKFLTTPDGSLIVAGIMGTAPGLIAQAVYSVKLDGRLAEARTELARVRAAAEIAKMEIAKMKSITKLAITATETLQALKKVGDGAVSNLSNTVKAYGTDYALFPETEKDTTWLTFKIMSALNEFVNMNLLTPSGAISAKFRKFVGDTGTEFLEDHIGECHE